MKGWLHRAGLIRSGLQFLDMSGRLGWMSLPARYPLLEYSSVETLCLCLSLPDCLHRLCQRRRPSQLRLPSSARTPPPELAISWSSDAPISYWSVEPRKRNAAGDNAMLAVTTNRSGSIPAGYKLAGLPARTALHSFGCCER